jgi:hypothetical protein
MSALRTSTSQNYRELREKMNAELQPYLTSEQIKRLQERHRPPDHERSQKNVPGNIIDSPVLKIPDTTRKDITRPENVK